MGAAAQFCRACGSAVHRSPKAKQANTVAEQSQGSLHAGQLPGSVAPGNANHSNSPVLVGVIVLLAGVVVGLLFLLLRDDGDSTAGSDNTTASSVPSATDVSALVPTETAPFDYGLSPIDIPVVVANGSGVSGAAGAVTELLVAAGYNPGAATDTNVPTSETALDTVYYITAPESFEAQAQQVAADLGLPAEAVLEMPPTLPVAPEDLGLAAVLIILGSAPGGLATTTAG